MVTFPANFTMDQRQILKSENPMKKPVLLLVVGCLIFASQQMARAESHLDKLDWEKQLSEAQKNNDYGSCHEVVIAAYLDNNQSVLNKAAEICWPIGKNVQKLKPAWAIMGVESKEDYINFVGKSLGAPNKPDEQK
jgi:hypothetical protein